MMRTPRHYVARFFSSITARRVRVEDRTFVEAHLSEVELLLWSKLSRADALESIRVARRVERDDRVSADERGDVIAAALLHDVGKLDARLGTYGRSVATIAGAFAGRDMAEVWRHSRGFTRRVGLYLQHPELGAQRIRLVGGRDVAAQWAAAHHDPTAWPGVALSSAACLALAAADGERDLGDASGAA